MHEPPSHPTITADQRHALHEWLIWHLRSTLETFGEDITDREDSSHTRDHLATIDDGIALLNDLGWPKDDTRDTFEITIPEERLNRLLTRIREDASLTLFRYYTLKEPDHETDAERREAIMMCRAYGRIQRHYTRLHLAERERTRGTQNEADTRKDA